MSMKYEISLIDGNEYCRKNGQFLRHLKSNGYDYKSYYDNFIGEEQFCAHCGDSKKFCKSKMRYLKTCGKPVCIGKESSEFKQTNFTKKTWEEQAEKYRITMASKTEEELDIIHKKRQATNLEKYGSEHPWGSPEVRKKIYDTMESKYGVSNFSYTLISDETQSKLDDSDWMYEQHITKQQSCLAIAKKLQISDITVKNYLLSHNITVHKYNSSSGESELVEFIKKLPVNVIENDRTILSSGRELDIFLPDHNLAIEFCGLFWHSDYHPRIDKRYHYDKYLGCKDRNIELWTIFEDEWDQASHIIKKKLLYKLNMVEDKVYARNTEFREISSTESKSFLVNNHIQGNGNGRHKYGLFCDDEIVAVMVLRHGDIGEYVLDRFCTSKNVVGGFSKLLNNAINQLEDCNKIITFADCRWSNGKLYELHDFTLDKFLEPDYSYIQNGTRYHKFNFRRKQLSKRLNHFDPSLSESENCRRNNVFKIYDCGKLRYVKNVR